MVLSIRASATPRAVAGRAQHGHDVRARVERQISFQLAGVHRLHVCKHELVRIGCLHIGDDAQSLLFDQRGSQFDTRQSDLDFGF